MNWKSDYFTILHLKAEEMGDLHGVTGGVRDLCEWIESKRVEKSNSKVIYINDIFETSTRWYEHH